MVTYQQRMSVRCPCCVEYRILFKKVQISKFSWDGWLPLRFESVQYVLLRYNLSVPQLSLEMLWSWIFRQAAAHGTMQLQLTSDRRWGRSILRRCWQHVKSVSVVESLDVLCHLMQTYAYSNHDVARFSSWWWHHNKCIRQTNPTRYPLWRNTSIWSLLMNLQQSSCRTLPPVECSWKLCRRLTWPALAMWNYCTRSKIEREHFIDFCPSICRERGNAQVESQHITQYNRTSQPLNAMHDTSQHSIAQHSTRQRRKKQAYVSLSLDARMCPLPLPAEPQWLSMSLCLVAVTTNAVTDGSLLQQLRRLLVLLILDVIWMQASSMLVYGGICCTRYVCSILLWRWCYAGLAIYTHTAARQWYKLSSNHEVAD
jgi:hypothetical protein